MISRGPDLNDFIWALDHSRRRYLARESRYTDLAYFPDSNPKGKITVVQLHDRVEMVVLPLGPDTHSEKWVNTDVYAEFCLKAIKHRLSRRDQRDH